MKSKGIAGISERISFGSKATPDDGHFVTVRLDAGLSVIVIDNTTGKPIDVFGNADLDAPSPLFKRALLEVERGWDSLGEMAYQIAAETDEAAFADVQAQRRKDLQASGGKKSVAKRVAKNADRDSWILELHATKKYSAEQIVKKLVSGRPVIDPETGKPVIDPITGSPVIEKFFKDPVTLEPWSKGTVQYVIRKNKPLN